MKKLLCLLCGSALILSPIVVLAQDTGTDAPAGAQAQGEGKDKSPRPLFPTPENIRHIASSTKLFIENRPHPTASSSEEMRAELRQKIEDKRQEVEQHVQEAKDKAAQKFGEAVQRSVGNITDSLTKALTNLTNIANRIDARITELQGKGFSMTNSITLLAQARVDITTAQTDITAVGTLLSSALSSSTPKNALPGLRRAVKIAEDAIHVAKQSLQKTLNSVRIEGHATSSPQTANQ